MEIDVARQDIKLYLTSGYLIFSKPVHGRRLSVLFSTAVEGGDGEVLVLPPDRAERLSLEKFAQSPNLDEHFTATLMLFSDNTAEELERKIAGGVGGATFVKKDPEAGQKLAQSWSPVLRNLSESYLVRLVHDLMGPPGNGLFFAAIAGKRLGNFDVEYDPTTPEQILVGQIAYRDNQAFYNIWTSFRDRSSRKTDAPPPKPPFRLENFRIQASLEAGLTIKATTRVTLVAEERVSRALPFLISSQMRITSAKMDGHPVEVFDRESLRANLTRGEGNKIFLIVAPEDIATGSKHELEFEHEGDVILQAGQGAYFVGSRNTWYPQEGDSFARFDLTFRYPRDLDFVATGEAVEDRTEGDWRITRRVTDVPIRFAGFNLGHYRKAAFASDCCRIEVYADSNLPTQPPATLLLPVKPAWPPRLNSAIPRTPVTSPANSDDHFESLAHNILSAFQFLTSELGPPPLKTLIVSPIPGTFGQGFPGLVYLSTLAYLDPSRRPAEEQGRFASVFFSDLIAAHEVAHQWWGNLIVPATPHDEWLMEALANYSALLYLERTKGRKAMDEMLNEYRGHLLLKNASGRLESAGPIVWGLRLTSSQSPQAWRVITYEKGSWIIHMLRVRLGDEKFAAMLREACRRYRFQTMSTEQFQHLAEEYTDGHASLQEFFDNWVYGTGIPKLKLDYEIHGLEIKGTVAQTDVTSDFSASVPVTIQYGRKTKTVWVETGSDPASFSARLPLRPVEAWIDPGDGLYVVSK